MRERFLSRDTRHLRILLLLIVVVATAVGLVRSQLVPSTFGLNGPYRAAALTEATRTSSRYQSDSTCLSCHDDVRQERADAVHSVVGCVHCHGLGIEHVRLARQAAGTPGNTVPPAADWDGDFLTSLDLFVTRDRATCLVCHRSTVGMPDMFQQINVAEHLEENEASEPASREVCFECHGGHDTAP
jgi:hypothetical protein